MRIVLLTSAIVMFAATQASAGHLTVLNGGFEDPVGVSTINPGSTTGNWTVANRTAFIAPAASFTGIAAFEGDQYIQLDSRSGGGRISQLLGTTDAGLASNITLSAYFYERPDNAGATYSFGLYSDAAGTVSLGGEKTGQTPVQSWTQDSVTAVGVAPGTSVYAFFSADSDGAPRLFWIDDATLSVTQIPEPSSMLLVGLGVLGLGVVRRRRR